MDPDCADGDSPGTCHHIDGGGLQDLLPVELGQGLSIRHVLLKGEVSRSPGHAVPGGRERGDPDAAHSPGGPAGSGQAGRHVRPECTDVGT